jgi:hypothetical protein
MAFKAFDFQPIGGQVGRNGFWIYRTTDTLSQVKALGYFNPVHDDVKVGDTIHLHILDSVENPTVVYGTYTIHIHSNASGVVRITTSVRDANVPTLVSPQPPNAMTWFEDFCTSSVAPARFAVGTVADPNTITHQAPYGNAAWSVGTIAGTTNKVGLHGSDGEQNYIGCLSIATGTTVGNGAMIDMGGRETSSPGNDVFSLGSSEIESVGMWRWRYDSGTDLHITGIGWVIGVAPGTDWITDPDTTLTTGTAGGVIIHRVSDAVYSGDPAGALMLRTYDALGGTQFLQLASSILTDTATWHKVEVRSKEGILYVYYQDAYVGSLDISGHANDNCRPSAGFKRITSGATARALRIDCYYQEVETPVTR